MSRTAALSTMLMLSMLTACGGPAGQSEGEARDDAVITEGGRTTPSAPDRAPEATADRTPLRALAQADSQNGNFRLAITEATRREGILTLKASITLLDGPGGGHRFLDPRESGELYVVAGDRKYMILKDNEGEPLTTADGFEARFGGLGASNAWWGKFPAPPPEARTVDLHFREFQPVEGIPITDR